MPNSEYSLDFQAEAADAGIQFVQKLSVVRSHSADRITWHSHPSFEVVLLSDGATAYEFQQASTAELTGGQFLVVPPNAVHRGLNDVRRPAQFCGVMISATSSCATSNTPFGPTDLVWIQQRLAQASLRPKKMSRDLKIQVKGLPGLVKNYDPNSRQSAVRTRIKICELVFEIASHLDSTHSAAGTGLVEEVIRLMKAHLETPVSISVLANRVGCSRAKLFEVFKEITGMTPSDYWQRMRIERAHDLVVGSNESMTKIAMKFGFSSSQYFCTVFRKYYGISPSDGRRRNGSGPAMGLQNLKLPP